MRTEIIITVKDQKKTVTYDLEVPVHITAKKAAADICEVINYHQGIQVIPKGEHSLKNERTAQVLKPDRTLYENGVWQGDILIII